MPDWPLTLGKSRRKHKRMTYKASEARRRVRPDVPSLAGVLARRAAKKTSQLFKEKAGRSMTPKEFEKALRGAKAPALGKARKVPPGFDI